MGLWIERYKENEEIRVAVEKMLLSIDDKQCHPECLALKTYRKCALFGYLKYDNGQTCRSKKCKRFFGNDIVVDFN